MTKNRLAFHEAFEQAQTAAMSYDPISLNKDPGLLQLRRNDYAYGYAAGLMAQRTEDEPSQSPLRLPGVDPATGLPDPALQRAQLPYGPSAEDLALHMIRSQLK